MKALMKINPATFEVPHDWRSKAPVREWFAAADAYAASEAMRCAKLTALEGVEGVYDLPMLDLPWSPVYFGSTTPVAWVSKTTGERCEGPDYPEAPQVSH